MGPQVSRNSLFAEGFMQRLSDWICCCPILLEPAVLFINFQQKYKINKYKQFMVMLCCYFWSEENGTNYGLLRDTTPYSNF